MKYPRSLAVRVLTQVLSEHRPLDEVLAVETKVLDPEVVAWLYEITAGTLRWKGRLDWVLDSVAARKKPSGWLRKILLLSAYQLIVQDRAPVAFVVSETVDEVKKMEGEAPSKFANACLRKIASQAQEWRTWTYPENKDPMTPQSAAWASLPSWFWNKLVHQRGLEWAKGFAGASLERPQLWIRARDLQQKLEGFDSLVPGGVPGSWTPSQASGGGISERTGFAEGEWIVQDVSSQFLIAQVSGKIRELRGEGSLTALDLCAAPGGKSVGLCWSGFRVSSTDIRPDRVLLLQDTIARAAPEIEYLPWEQVMGSSPSPKHHWDLVWVDAPCSGSGIVRRHPDVRWLRQEKEIAVLVQQQKKLIREAWDRVAPGGFLAYSVCSIFSDEGERVVVDFVKDLASHAQEKPTLVQEWLLGPHLSSQGDGFWGALLRK